MEPTALLPLRRKACWGFFCPKNLTASAGCEPANLGTKGQHATSRPPKPLTQPVLPITMWCTATLSHKRYRNRKITAFWDVKLWQWVSVPDILKKRKTMGISNLINAVMFHSNMLPPSLEYSDDGSKKFLTNICIYLPGCTMSHPRRQYSYLHSHHYVKNLTLQKESNSLCITKLAYKIKTMGNYPEESIQHSEHGKSLKSRKIHCYYCSDLQPWPDWEMWVPGQAINFTHLKIGIL
jgi:hypothetical protein